jgi:hypothetical protein
MSNPHNVQLEQTVGEQGKPVFRIYHEDNLHGRDLDAHSEDGVTWYIQVAVEGRIPMPEGARAMFYEPAYDVTTYRKPITLAEVIEAVNARQRGE